MGLERIGLTALNAAQLGLTTTGHNIANVSTPGYHRQQILQSAQTPLFTGAGFVGQGVQVDTIRRAYNKFLDNQVVSAETQASQLDTYLTEITQINNMLADSSAGLSPALQDFFSGVNGVVTSPASVPARQAMLSGGQALVARFQALDDRFSEVRDGVNSQITSSVSVINSYAQQIANLNDRINAAQASTTQPANDLLDQRDELVRQLNQEIQASVVQQSDGTFSVYIGSGQPLVVGMQTFRLAVAPSLDDPNQFEVGLATPGGTSVLPENSLQGGHLGGLLAFRSESLDSAQNSLGRVAIGLAQTFNAQHQLGQDLNDDLGGDFFAAPTLSLNNGIIAKQGNTAGLTVNAAVTDVGALTTADYRLQYDGTNWSLINFATKQVVPMAGAGTAGSPFVADGLSIVVGGSAPQAGDSFLIQPTRNAARDIGMAITDPTKVAAAAPILASASIANTGTGTISQGTVNATPVVADTVTPHPATDLNLRQPVTITFIDATHLSVSGVGVPAADSAPPYVSYTPGGNITYNGWTVQISGAPAAGDTFTIKSNAGGVSDNRNATLLAALQTTNTLAGKTTSYQGAYGQLVSDVGNKTNEITVTSQAQAAVVAQTQQTQQSFSGVNLDEEAANLTRYQQAYQAAGQMISISNTLFQTLLTQIGG